MIYKGGKNMITIQDYPKEVQPLVRMKVLECGVLTTFMALLIWLIPKATGTFFFIFAIISMLLATIILFFKKFIELRELYPKDTR